MSFLLLQGVLRSRQLINASRVLCRTCLAKNKYLYNKSARHISTNSTLITTRLTSHTNQKYVLSSTSSKSLLNHSSYFSPCQLQRKYLNILLPSTPEIDHSELYELNNLLSQPLPSSTTAAATTTAITTTATTKLKPNIKNHHIIRKRNYRKRLIKLYESIRRQPTLWHQLNVNQLISLYHIIKPTIFHPSFTILNINAQHILQDIQYHTPHRFTSLHAEWLLTCYKENGELNLALELMENPSLNPTPKMYRIMVGFLTTTCRYQDQPLTQKMMKLSYSYFQKFKQQQSSIIDDSNNNIDYDLMLGYLMLGHLSKNHILQAASLISTHSPHWFTSSSSDNNNAITDHFKQITIGLEKMLTLFGKQWNTKNEFNYGDARQLYKDQCQFYKKYNNNMIMNNGTTELESQPIAGLLQLVQQCIRMERLDWAHELLNDAIYYNHHHGKKMIGRHLVQAYMAKDNLRYALDIYFDLINKEGNLHHHHHHHLQQHNSNNEFSGANGGDHYLQSEMIFPIEQTKSLLIKAAKAKYQMDVYRLYQYMMKTSPLSLDLRLYTRILQTFIRTKHYHYAHQIAHDALRQSDIYQSTTSSLHTNRFFNTIYSFCAQTGDLELFQKVVSIQRAVGLHDLHHHSLTSLMSTYIKANQIPSAKAVFDHLNQFHHQQHLKDQQQPQPQSTSFEEHSIKPGVDVIDYNLLLLAVTKEEKEKGSITNHVLEILRQMSDRGISPNKTTLRTLLAIYKKENVSAMEEELFHQLLKDTKATREDHIWLNNMKLTKLMHHQSNNNDDDNDKEHEKKVLLATQLFLSNQREKLFPTLLTSPSSSSTSSSSSTPEPILANGMTYKILLDQLTKYPKHANLAHTLYHQMRLKGWRLSMAMYEQIMIMWIQKGRYQKMKSVMNDYCQDMGLQHPPTKMYTVVLDHLMMSKKKQKFIRYWINMIKEDNIPVDALLEKRLKDYGLYDQFASSNLNPSSSSSASSSVSSSASSSL